MVDKDYKNGPFQNPEQPKKERPSEPQASLFDKDGTPPEVLRSLIEEEKVKEIARTWNERKPIEFKFSRNKEFQDVPVAVMDLLDPKTLERLFKYNVPMTDEQIMRLKPEKYVDTLKQKIRETQLARGLKIQESDEKLHKAAVVPNPENKPTGVKRQRR